MLGGLIPVPTGPNAISDHLLDEMLADLLEDDIIWS